MDCSDNINIKSPAQAYMAARFQDLITGLMGQGYRNLADIREAADIAFAREERNVAAKRGTTAA